MTYQVRDIIEQLHCPESHAVAIYNLAVLGGGFSNDSREQLNARYRSAYVALRVMGKLPKE